MTGRSINNSGGNVEKKRKYGEAVAEITVVKPVIACAHQGCPEPAMTRDKANAPLCRTHWEHRHLLETRQWLKSRDIYPGKESARYQLSKMAARLAEKWSGKGNRDWAHKIIQRSEDGEMVPYRALSTAKEALSRREAK